MRLFLSAVVACGLLGLPAAAERRAFSPSPGSTECSFEELNWRADSEEIERCGLEDGTAFCGLDGWECCFDDGICLQFDYTDASAGRRPIGGYQIEAPIGFGERPADPGGRLGSRPPVAGGAGPVDRAASATPRGADELVCCSGFYGGLEQTTRSECAARAGDVQPDERCDRN